MPSQWAAIVDALSERHYGLTRLLQVYPKDGYDAAGWQVGIHPLPGYVWPGETYTTLITAETPDGVLTSVLGLAPAAVEA